MSVTSESLPESFKALEPWVAQWSIPHEAGRLGKRLSADARELNRFVAAVLPRIEEIIDYLNRVPGNDPDALHPDERRLFDMALTCMEAAIPGDLGWEGNDIEDSWPVERLTFLAPSIFPEPENRK
ncbi:MAG: hypothetical protein EXR28_04610 [Betaproteobacteria bacterium]|nr:hypothetical protein [Betaproteobacteria bacterium]